jgi:hypothetical protein
MRYGIKRRLAGFTLVATAAALVAACDLDVTNPGPVEDEALNDPSVFGAVVTGMSADYSFALAGLLRYTSIFADELAHSGSYNAEGFLYRGQWPDDIANSRWGQLHRARWVAEDGLRRMASVLDTGPFEASPLATRAYVFAGIANRTLAAKNPAQIAS